ncbi:MAG: conjugative transposon protein TraM [Cyclobacteriaceae bacterium]|nr:conjugative transposon protein TraM [Cyclobacteriaceae bacterium]
MIKKEQFIQAIIDEDIKVYPGSRVRIRLLDDIYAGDQLIEKGNYLFGTVTAFKPQRIEISISSILVNDKISNVDLKVYDNDGIPGLYVPASQFRGFTKDLSSSVASGQNFQFSNTPENHTEMLYSMAEKAYSTAARSVGKAAKKNKAKRKYNTVLYLVNSNEIN